MIQLYYPPDFTSPSTFQNVNFPFPHTTILSLTPKEVATWFIKPSYIIPSYLHYLHAVDVNLYDMLSQQSTFLTLGIAFMKLKGLEEQVDSLFARALVWKQDHVAKKFQNNIDLFITVEYQQQIFSLISYVTTMFQLIIITMMVDAMDHHDIDVLIIPSLLQLLQQFNTITIMDIDVSITINMARIVPLLIEINNIMVTYYQIV